eukprot:38502_1
MLQSMSFSALIVSLTVALTLAQNSDNCWNMISGRNTTRIRQGIEDGYVAKSTFTVFYTNNSFYEVYLENQTVTTGGNYSLFADENDKTVCHLRRNTTDKQGIPRSECETLIPIDLKSNAIRGMEGCLNEPNKPVCLGSCYTEKGRLLNEDLVAYYDNGAADMKQVKLDLAKLKNTFD